MTAPAQGNSPLINESTDNHVRWITLNRPNQRNPLSSAMLATLTDALARAGDDPNVRAIVLTG